LNQTIAYDNDKCKNVVYHTGLLRSDIEIAHIKMVTALLQHITRHVDCCKSKTIITISIFAVFDMSLCR